MEMVLDDGRNRLVLHWQWFSELVALMKITMDGLMRTIRFFKLRLWEKTADGNIESVLAREEELSILDGLLPL